MKDYINYMDNITPDAALKGRILKKARQKPALAAKSRSVLGYAGLVATAAVLLLGMWVMPGTIRNLRDHGQDGQVLRLDGTNNASPENWASGTPIQTPPRVGPGGHEGGGIAGGNGSYMHNRAGEDETGTPIPPREEREQDLTNQPGEPSGISPNNLEPISPRYFSDDGGDTWREVMIFSHELTHDQFIHVFPSLDAKYTGRAVYSHDGTLLEVHAQYVNTHGQYINIQVNSCEYAYSVTTGRTNWMLDIDTQVVDMHGVPVTILAHDTAGFYNAVFVLDGIGYLVSIFGMPDNMHYLAQEVITSLILGGAADLTVLANPEIPLLRNDHITLEEASHDPDFGMYMPHNIPADMTIGLVNRWICQNSDFLLAWWDGNPNSHLRWMIRRAGFHHRENLLDAHDIEFLERRQSLPVFDGESHRARRAFSIPAISAQDLTLEVLETLAVWIDGHMSVDTGWYIFSLVIMYDDIVIEINASGLTAQQIWDMLP
ncbi:MAG: hypothetical protein FWC92_05520 [Defluviitaleaceae bacterium]|nr:hypothetical protein [Defluviitaleaceae bacterium]